MFSDASQSHQHSLETLEQLNEFIEFKRSIKSLLDLGCGSGFDLNYWASLEDGDEDTPKRLDINCIGLSDKINSDLEAVAIKNKNVTLKQHDFNLDYEIPIGKKVDVIWCHNVLQYCHSPLMILQSVSNTLTKNGMLYLCVPSTINVNYGRFKNYTYDHQFNTFTATQLIYLLALCGFDCDDFYLKKEKHQDLIQIITYKNRDPFAANSTWYELLEAGCFSNNIKDIIMSYGYLTDQGLITKWLDGVVYDYRSHSRA
jgi:SAM-dependent methyltransferase